MRKILVLFLVLIMGLAADSLSSKDYKFIEETFDKSGLQFESANINAWVNMNTQQGDFDHLKDTAHYISKNMSFSIKEEKHILDNSTKNVIISGDLYGGNITVKTTSFFDNSTGKYNMVAEVDITQTKGIKNIIDIRERLNECLKKWQDAPDINVCVTGYVDGKIDKKQEMKIIEGVFNDAGAVNLQTVDDGSIISVTGFTYKIPYSINCYKKNININMACRYSAYNDRTYFLLGIPVINMEY